MASTQFYPTGLEYLIMDYDQKEQKVIPIDPTIKEVKLTFTRDAEGSWVLNNNDKIVGMIGKGMLTGMLFPANDVNKAAPPITKLPKKFKK
jgi:hypothetical protein